MATLWLNEAAAEGSSDLCSSASPALREWLAGDWGLVFSHPDDFQSGGLEIDRWLSILRDEFFRRGVRPLACTRAPPTRDTSWVSQIVSDERVVVLRESAAAAPGIVDLPQRSLREDMLGLRERFALIIDENLHQRGILKYSPGRSSVSPFDLLSLIDALRRRAGRTAA